MEENILEQIQKTIEKIRPYIQNDGGDVQFVKYEDGIVYVSVHGACVGCMALDYTLKEGVEALLLDEVEGIKEVRLIDEFEEIKKETNKDDINEKDV